MSALNVTLIQGVGVMDGLFFSCIPWGIIVRLAFLETVEGLAFRARKGFSSIR